MYVIFHHYRNLPQAFLVVQKEFAEKLTAPAGSDAYNVLSVLTQILARAEMLFSIPATVFSPPPKVESACLVLRFRHIDIDTDKLKKLVQTAFSQRRKKMRNSLKNIYRPELETQFPWEMRADALAPEQYLALMRLSGNRELT
jgi:16S rRNA (adenine1518-N6/adenine1519-N6)-dimethyltransferase